ncbi:MAG TPA: hypothetical protein VNS32_10065 [Flavisolibacter sp.]|nr:hypothetical protein [Flavisolibacter sp.]
MKKLWLLGIVVLLAIACNNDATTQPTDTDHTENRDTSAVDSMHVFTDTSGAHKPASASDSSK